jgi:hypothetical protein
MIDKKYIEMMNLEIDGALSPEGHRELERYLESHQDAREYFDGLRSTASMLDRTEEIEPPAALTKSIIKTVFERDSRAEDMCLSTGGRSWMASRWRPGFAFAAGLVAGLFLSASAMLILIKSPPGTEGIYGTISRLKGAVTERTTIIDGAELRGTVHTRISGERIMAELDVWSRNEVLVKLIHGGAVSFEGVRSLRPATSRISVFEDRVELVLSGDGGFIVGLSEKGGSRSPVDLMITSNGEVLFSERIVQEVQR